MGRPTLAGIRRTIGRPRPNVVDSEPTTTSSPTWTQSTPIPPSSAVFGSCSTKLDPDFGQLWGDFDLTRPDCPKSSRQPAPGGAIFRLRPCARHNGGLFCFMASKTHHHEPPNEAMRRERQDAILRARADRKGENRSARRRQARLSFARDGAWRATLSAEGNGAVSWGCAHARARAKADAERSASCRRRRWRADGTRTLPS